MGHVENDRVRRFAGRWQKQVDGERRVVVTGRQFDSLVCPGRTERLQIRHGRVQRHRGLVRELLCEDAVGRVTDGLQRREVDALRNDRLAQVFRCRTALHGAQAAHTVQV